MSKNNIGLIIFSLTCEVKKHFIMEKLLIFIAYFAVKLCQQILIKNKNQALKKKVCAKQIKLFKKRIPIGQKNIKILPL